MDLYNLIIYKEVTEDVQHLLYKFKIKTHFQTVQFSITHDVVNKLKPWQLHQYLIEVSKRKLEINREFYDRN